MTRQRLANTRTLPLAALGVGLLLLVSLALGPVALSPGELLREALDWLGSTPRPPSLAATVFFELRLPRSLLAVLAGAALALAGALMQAFFRNPLADPALIGVSGGAAVAAVAFIVLGAGTSWLAVAAFAGALAAVAIVLRLARDGLQLDAATMLLAGIALNALAGAAIGFMIHLADDRQLRGLTFWTLGSLSGSGWQPVVWLSLALGLAAWVLRGMGRRLNVLLLGEAEAGHLGLGVEALKRRLLWITALLAGTAVAVCGIIGFVGLVAPHLARLMVGPDHRRLLPLSALLGSGLLLAADSLARAVSRGAELPIGVLTALVGAPLFLWLLRASRRPLLP